MHEQQQKKKKETKKYFLCNQRAKGLDSNACINGISSIVIVF